MNRIFLSLLLLMVTVAPLWAVDSPVPRVAVSIKPLHSLVSGVMQGVGQPDLVVKSGGSPHGYVLRPSEAQLLSKAQLVVWVGHELESFLNKPLATLGKKAMQLELAEELKPFLLSPRKGDDWDSHAHKQGSEHVDDAHGEHQYIKPDLHLWLDPAIAKQIVTLTANALVELDPTRENQYQANARQMIERLDQLDMHLKQKLEAVQGVPYIVFHAAYQYFEAAYGLNAVGSITLDPGRAPGAKKISEIHHKIKELNARCVFSEPQFESRLVTTVIEGTNARTGILDPLGADLPAGPDAYFQLMTRLGDGLYEGLK